MYFDRTRIAIRERGLLETCDLALHVAREFAGPLAMTALLAIVPLVLLNYALIGWMVPAEADHEFHGGRLLWNMSVLVYLEAPLASMFMVAYLGPAVFLEERSLRQVVTEVLRYLPHLALSHGLFRGLAAAWLLYLTLDRLPEGEMNGFVEVFLMIVLVLWSTVARIFRPYINEIILLEKNPLRSRSPSSITIGKRSAHLHGPYAGDLFVRWVGAAMIGLLLLAMTLATVIALQIVLVSDWLVTIATDGLPELIWNLDWFKLQVLYPACLWLVAVFFSVVRFLSYLDLRIRHEGWEVELLMRAEALQLAARME